ncbi:MAG: hypothetical protein O3A95_02710 [Planctomycetota bacterium]|nr:hypothetical protein [Planctomycetota bacterium]
MTHARLYALLFPALLGCALFLSVLPGEFVYDDRSLLSLNPNFQEWSVVLKAFTTPYWELVDAERFSSGFYRPVGAAVLGAGWQLGNGDPIFFHGISLLLHAACSMAVAALALSFGWRPLLAGGAGILFAMSGVHAEPVAWISAIPDLLATLFCLLGLRALVQKRMVGVGVFFLLAMLSKEAAFGAWALAIGVVVLQRHWKMLGPLAVAGVMVYGLRVNAFDSLVAGFDRVNTHHGLNGQEQFVLSLSLIGDYLKFLVWPWPHAPFRPLRVDAAGFDARLISAVLGGLATLLAGGFWFLRAHRFPTAMFGLGLLFAGLVPVLNSNALGQYPFEERFLYLPSAGFAILLVGVLAWLSGKIKNEKFLPVAIAVIAIPNAVSAWSGSKHWLNEETLFSWAQEASPGAMTGHIEFGRLMLERAQASADPLDRDRYTEYALSAYRRSLEIQPDKVFVTSVEREKGNLGLGDALYLSGDFQAAEAVYMQTVEHYRFSPLGFLGLANCRGQFAMRHLQEGHPSLADLAFEAAVGHFNTALIQSPGLPNAIIGKANALAQLGKFEKALPLAEEGFNFAPDRLDVAQLLFTLYYGKQDFARATATLETFLLRNPEHPQAFVVQQTLDQMRTISSEPPR